MNKNENNNKSPEIRRLRGTGIYQGDEFTFRPSEQGEPAQRNVKTVKGAKSFETTSTKNPLRVAHLTCPADSADPWQEFTDQLERLGIKPQQAAKKPSNQRIVDDGGMEVWLDSKNGRLTYQGFIDLSRAFNWQGELMRQLQIIVRTLPMHEKFKKTIIKFKKGGRE